MLDAALAIEVVAAGADVVRRRAGPQLERYAKGEGDFATIADIESEAAMLALLRRERPADAILAEESGRGGGESRRIWLIDPLCGTLNYAAGMRVVAVNAALRDGERIIAGAVADPFAREIMWTDGESAWIRVDGRDTALAPSAASGLVDLNLDAPFPSAPAFRAVALAADLEFVTAFKPRVVSSSLALAWVATGQRAAYVTDGDVRNSVHFAAGLALCEAARCVISDVFGATAGRAATGLIAAADANTHARLLGLAASRRA